MKNLIIIGAGGYGRNIYHMAIDWIKENKDIQIKGFIDDNKEALSGFDNYPPIIDTINDYVVKKGDIFVCSIGSVPIKKKIVQNILNKKGEFISLIHPTAQVSLNAKIGKGCIIGRNAVVLCDSTLGDYVLIQTATVIGHDVIIGDYSRIDCQAVCLGGIRIGNEVTVHTSAIINLNVVIESRAVIGAGSFVIRKVKENTTVFGNPALRLR